MLRHWIVAGFLTIAGCGGGGRVSAPQPAEDPARLASLQVAGEWGQPVNGVRARVLLDRKELQETQAVTAAVELENVGNSAAEVRNVVNWQSAGVSLNAPQPTDAAVPTVTLAPGQKLTTRTAEILIPPGSARRELAATVGNVAAAPIGLAVRPAEWGQSVGGLRIRVAAPRDVYRVGEQAVLRIFFHNASAQPLTLHHVDDDSQDVDTRRDVLTFNYRTLDSTTRELAPGAVAVHEVPEPLLLAPGRYRLRVVLTSRELSIDHPSAWHGRIVSNDFPLRIE